MVAEGGLEISRAAFQVVSAVVTAVVPLTMCQDMGQVAASRTMASIGDAGSILPGSMG